MVHVSDNAINNSIFNNNDAIHTINAARVLAKCLWQSVLVISQWYLTLRMIRMIQVIKTWV